MHKLNTRLEASFSARMKRRVADFTFWTVWLFASTALVVRFAMEFLP